LEEASPDFVTKLPTSGRSEVVASPQKPLILLLLLSIG
jgi:hypothetical protein